MPKILEISMLCAACAISNYDASLNACKRKTTDLTTSNARLQGNDSGGESDKKTLTDWRMYVPLLDMTEHRAAEKKKR